MRTGNDDGVKKTLGFKCFILNGLESVTLESELFVFIFHVQFKEAYDTGACVRKGII